MAYFFEDPLTADYNRLTNQMINGIWNVTEPGMPGFGGSGNWTVTWQPWEP